MIKRIMSITLMVALVLTQSSIAGAFISDGTQGPYVATLDLSGGATEASLTVAIKKVSDNSADTEVGWSGVDLGDGWSVSTQYMEVTYAANQVGWGIQIYTDNMDLAASPRYEGDPTTNPTEQPAGLIGTLNKDLTCPMAILVYDELIASALIAVPVETSSGTPGQADFVKYFTTGYDEIAGGDHEFTWFWLKDQGGTFWDDADSDSVLDPGELISGFSSTGDDYATIVNTIGASSGWVSAVTGFMQRAAGPASPIHTYFAADFTNATELQEYKTNTLELEIYHD